MLIYILKKGVFMKKFSLIFVVVILVGISVCSCAVHSNKDNSDQLAALESQLAMLSVAESEGARRIEELLGQIADLEKQTDTSPPTETTANSDEPKKVGFTYTVSDEGATVTGYVGTEKNIVIPASIDGYSVVAIGDKAFLDTDLESVIISESVKSVGWFAFDGCVKLKSITVPSSVTSIGYYAFGSAEASSTIYCHADSFALQYAKSYGLSYTVI